MAKPCPISKTDFMAKAEPIKVDVAGTMMTAEPRDFATGSFGWYLSGKVSVRMSSLAASSQ